MSRPAGRLILAGFLAATVLVMAGTFFGIGSQPWPLGAKLMVCGIALFAFCGVASLFGDHI